MSGTESKGIATATPDGSRHEGFDRSTWRGRIRWFAAEFLVVLAGILAAFTIDAWWAHRHDRIEEITALQELDSALAADISDLQGDLTEYKTLMHSDSVLTAALAQHTPISDSLLASVGDLTIHRTHVANSGPFESLKARGLGLISDDSLRLGLVDFYGNQTESVALVNTMNTEIVQKLLWPYYLGHVQMAADRSDSSLIRANWPRLANDAYFYLLLRHQLQEVRNAVPVYDTALTRAQWLRQRVETDLR